MIINGRFPVVFFLIVFVCGCVHIQPAPIQSPEIERVRYKSYTLGQKQSAFVGQPIVRVKYYTSISRESGYMQATDDFLLTRGNIRIEGQKGRKYRLRGQITVDGITFRVVEIPVLSDPRRRNGLLIHNDGRVYPKVLQMFDDVTALIGGAYGGVEFDVSPPSLRFVPSKKIEIDKNAPFLNYELIYGGTDGKSITVTYREYTREDMARTAFYQNVVYKADSGSIRFRDTKIQVHEVSNEKIVYTVLSDGLEKAGEADH